MSYARDGLPFLMSHENNTRAQVGLIEDVRLAGGKLRGLLRMGNNPDAGWVFADIRAGIMPNISVGYRINALQLESSDETGDTYRVTSWTPMEGSTVPVPADITVGAGRAASTGDETPVTISREATKEAQTMEQNTAPAAGATVTRDYDAERKQRNAEMVALADLAGMPGKLADALARDISPAQFARELQDAKIAAAEAAPSSALKLTPKEDRNYSLIRFFNAQLMARTGVQHAWDAAGAGFEREVSQEIASRMGKPGALYVPMSLTARASVTGNVATTTSLGGAGVQTSVMDLIEILRNALTVRALGARVLSGLQGNITFPRQITANTVNWTGENPSTGNTLGTLTLDNVTLSPKTAMVSSAVSRQLLAQASFDAEQLIRQDFASTIAIELDRVAIAGTGASNQPTGVLVQSGVTTVTTTFGANGSVPDWAAIVDFETQLSYNNAPTNAPWRWLITPGMRGKLKTVLQSTVNGATWLYHADGTMNGYEAAVSNNVPTNYTAGTSTTVCHGMILGNFSELLIGEWGGAIETIVDPYTVADQNMVKLHSMITTDIAVRHTKSFTITKAAKIA